MIDHRTDTALKWEGMDILIKNLGYVDAERFVALMNRESFDYTKWRQSNLEEECMDLRVRLEKEIGNKEVLYTDLINLILRVSDHILEDHKQMKKGVKDIMGGKVLELSSEKLIKKGRKEGRAEEHKANVEKLAQSYIDTKVAATMEDAVKMAEGILGK